MHPRNVPAKRAAFMGVDMPTVPAGDHVFPVLTTQPTVGGPHTDSSEVDETTGSFSGGCAFTEQDYRLAFWYKRTDRARFAGMDTALRSNLAAALADALRQASSSPALMASWERTGLPIR